MSAPATASAAPSNELARRARDFADVAALLAEEASALTLRMLGPGHESDVAHRAAAQAREAADALRAFAASGASAEATMRASTWVMSAAAIALGQAKLGAPLR